MDLLSYVHTITFESEHVTAPGEKLLDPPKSTKSRQSVNVKPQISIRLWRLTWFLRDFPFRQPQVRCVIVACEVRGVEPRLEVFRNQRRCGFFYSPNLLVPRILRSVRLCFPCLCELHSCFTSSSLLQAFLGNGLSSQMGFTDFDTVLYNLPRQSDRRKTQVSAFSSTLTSCILTYIKHCAGYGFAIVSFLAADRAGQFRTSLFLYAKTCMSGCQRFQKRLNTQPRGLEYIIGERRTAL